MSFSSDTKEELIGIETGRGCCKHAELSAVLRLAGVLSPGSAGSQIRIHTENAAAQRYVLKLIRRLYPDTEAIVLMHENPHLRKQRSFLLVISGERIREILQDAGFGAKETNFLQWNAGVLKKNCCKKAFLRASFMLCGSVSDPSKGYRIELVAKDEELTELICSLIRGLGMSCRMIERKGSIIAYLKDGESIADFLGHIGANNAVLELANIRALKEIRNNVNRAVNCETANYDKTTNAAEQQLESIRYIKEKTGLDKLSPKLKMLAEMRVNYPDATLQDLAEMLQEQIGRSGINHRLRKLNVIAQDLRARFGEDEQ